MAERELWIDGTPVPQGSKTPVMRKGRPSLVDDNAKRLHPWREHARKALEAAGWPPLLHGPVQVALGFHLARPKRHHVAADPSRELRADAPVWCDAFGRGDIDKLCRALLDAMTAAGVIRDDCQVAALRATRMWGPRPGVQVSLRPMETTP